MIVAADLDKVHTYCRLSHLSLAVTDSMLLCCVKPHALVQCPRTPLLKIEQHLCRTVTSTKRSFSGY